MQCKQVAEKYADAVWNHRDIKAIDKYIHPEVLIHSPLGIFRGIPALKEIVQVWLTGFPDLKVTNQLVISENDIVSVSWSAKGTHRGEFKGIAATGKPVSYEGATVYRVKNNQIVEYCAYIDMQHLLGQLT